MKVNARAPFQFLTAAVPHLKVQPVGTAAVVNVSSVNGQQSFAGCVSYCASKAALDMVGLPPWFSPRVSLPRALGCVRLKPDPSLLSPSLFPLNPNR